MIENTEILQPVVAAIALAFITTILKTYAPHRCSKLILKNGGTDKEADEAYKAEMERQYRLTRKMAPAYGFVSLPLILAVIGHYPDIAITLSWVLTFGCFSVGLFDAFSTQIMGGKTPIKIAGFKGKPIAFMMLGALIILITIIAGFWLLYITIMAVF